MKILLLILLLIPQIVFASVTVNPSADSVLPGSIRTVYSNTTGETPTSVTWSTSCGTITSSTGYTATWTAPASGTCTVTATANSTATAAATFTVVTTATVKASNIPMQSTVFKNQPLVIQSILWGSTNTAVTWTNSGGTLTGSGREVVFTASAAGTYTVTSTSQADNTKSATTTIVVTDNAYPAAARPNKTMPIDCTATGTGTTYNVTSEAEMDAVPWSTLGAGDTVRIYPGTYYKQLLISTSGTATQPIRICGVPDGSGNLPEINGANATAKAGSQYGTGLGDIQMYGGITIYNYGAAYYGSTPPNHIIIEGLKITGFNQDNTFTDLYTGLVTSYNKAAAAIRVQRGGNIVIRGNDITNNGNGLFTMAKNGIESQITRNLLVEGNYIHGNGVSGSYLEHQSYLQAFGLVVQGNYYDANLSGASGGQLKTRSVQQFVRYNFFKPAARMIDLVEEQDDLPLVFPWYGLDAGELPYTSTSDVVANYEAYQNQYIYGNILNNSGATATSWMVHAAADTSSQDYNYGGIVHFYHNTIYNSVPSNVAYRSGLFDFGPYQTAISTHTIWPTARMTNNAIYLDTTVSPSLTIFFLNRYQADRVILDKNWFSTAWGTGSATGGDGTGISTGAGDGGAAATWQGGTLSTQVSGMANIVTGSTLPFSATTYVPVSSSPLASAAASLSGLMAAQPPMMQYDPSTYLMSVRPTTVDIGAVAYDGAPPDTTPPITTPNKSGRYTASQLVELTANETATTAYCLSTSADCTPSVSYSAGVKVLVNQPYTKLCYRSTDSASNVETTKCSEFRKQRRK